ncbi:MAG TPA: ImmA/IrrE family metallo-endopeptidase [Ferruginibacter sp.]|nr:ImmA/IrrE family metallo-endopeptidase [Ferruginibacter sp.]
MKVDYNISRLNYLLGLFKLSHTDLLALISEGLKKPITEKDINSKEINISVLKRIDKIFNKGLHYYLDPKAPETSKEASIFFRKHDFTIELNIGAKKIVNHFEDFKISLSALATLADINIDRIMPIYKLSDNPKTVAKTIREELYPVFQTDLKEFLKGLITKFAERNILVFEFVETWNKKEKANIDGFFLNPNVIVLKRQQLSFRREIFTITHELGHFLLNEEEIESLDYQILAKTNLSSIENWCNDFAFHFLIGDKIQTFEDLDTADSTNDYHFTTIEEISKKTHLSQIALFTKLLFQKKISNLNYNKIRNDFEEKYKAKVEEDKKLRELEKQNGTPQGGSAPQPIKSPLLVSTIQTAFYEGIINEYEVCKRLNIKPENLDKYIE